MNLYSPGLGHSHVPPSPSVLGSQEMCQANSGGSDLGCGLGSILFFFEDVVGRCNVV